jgi:DNA helicase-2/ATP-dependent DNA helicase PcrA
MTAVGKHKDFHVEPIYQHCDSPTEAILDYFLPAIDQLNIELGDAAILAPWWRDLLAIGRELRKHGIPIIGPGSRPYRKSHEFAILSEALAAFLGTGTSSAAAAVQKALFVTLSNVTEIAVWMLYKYNGRRIIFRIINGARRVFEQYEGAADWLQHTASLCEDILIEEELLTESYRGIFTKSVTAMLNDMTRNELEVPNIPAVDLGIVGMPENCIQLLSMHKSKGKEFDAVAVINLHDGRVPFFGWKTQEDRDEYRRLLYVAATRPRKLLMFFTDSSNIKNQPSPYLKEPYLGMC